MKLELLLLLIFSSVSAFSFSVHHSQRTNAPLSSETALSLFGGKKDGSGDKKGPGMMDQIAMLKKAQEVASKKMAMDKELAKEDHVGSGADGKVKVTIKYVPPLPMQQPAYEGTAVDIDEDYLSSASSEELSAAVTEAIKDGYKQATAAVAVQMQELTKELGSIMGGAPGAAPGASS